VQRHTDESRLDTDDVDVVWSCEDTQGSGEGINEGLCGCVGNHVGRTVKASDRAYDTLWVVVFWVRIQL